MRIEQGVAHAVAYLHHDCSPQIVHRDITVNNILLKSEFEPRLSDFGVARLLNPDTTNWTTIAGSYGYMAPGKLQSNFLESELLFWPKNVSLNEKRASHIIKFFSCPVAK